MISSLQFYIDLIVATSPVIIAFALMCEILLAVPIYLYETRNGPLDRLEASNDKEIK